MYVDGNGMPLPGGTALGFGPVHQGIVAYLADRRQVILNTSLKHGKPVASAPEEFAADTVRIVRPIPQTWQESTRIQQNAWNLVNEGAPWSIFNNCQDFVSRSYSGKSGSETRTLFALGATFVILLGLATA